MDEYMITFKPSMLAISSNSGQFWDWTMWPEFCHLNNHNDNSNSGEDEQHSFPYSWCARGFENSSPLPLTHPFKEGVHRLLPFQNLS